MFVKLAIWYLRKRKVSVVLNCHFLEQTNVKVNENLVCVGNKLDGVVTLIFPDGTRVTL